MSLRPLLIRPGVIRDDTPLDSQGYLLDSNRIVYWRGRIQSMHGSTARKQARGVGRCCLEFAGNDGTPIFAFGTSSSLWALRGTDHLVDITPERTNGSFGSNPITTTAGSPVVTIALAAHGAGVGDQVHLRGLTTVGGLTLGGLSGTLAASPFTTTQGSNRILVVHTGHGILDNDIAYFASATDTGGILAADLNVATGLRAQRIDADKYYVWAPYPATSSASGGGTPTYAYTKSYSVVSVPTTSTFTIIAASNASSTVAGGGGAGGKYSFDISLGQNNAALSSNGFGTGRFGKGLFGRGEGRLLGQPQLAPVRPRNWSLSDFGQILIANIIGGSIFEWSSDNPSKRATVLTNAPVENTFVLVTPQRAVMSFGCTDTTGVFDPLLIRHTPPELRTVWTPSSINAARVERANEGSRLISAKVTSRGVVCWSDSAFYEVRFVGSLDQVYKPEVIGQGFGICGPHASAEVGDTLYWLDRQLMLLVWNGGTPTVQPYPFHNDLLQRSNLQQVEKIWAFADRAFPAAMWLYPNDISEEPDRYIRLDVNEQAGDPDAGWSRGEYDRTCWSTRRVYPNPMAISSTGVVHEHDQQYTDSGDPVAHFVTLAPIELDETGEDTILINSLVLDFLREEEVAISLMSRDYPEDEEVLAEGPYTVPVGQSTQDFRTRNRDIIIRFDWTSSKPFRFGRIRVDVSQQSQRGG